MSISSLLNIGSRAMNASYAQLTVTGNNIANANTAGYSRQSVELETAFSQQTGNGFFGKGVNIATVTRAHSDFLIREAALAGSIAAGDAARSSQLSQLENVFRLGEAGLGYAAQQMFNAFVDVASRPQDSSARQTVLARIGELAARFTSASGQLDALQGGVTDQLKSAVGSINSLTTQIADLNRRIANVKGTGHEPNELLDQRDRAIGELSKLVQVTTLAADDGTVGVFLGGGQKLVLGGNATPLVTVADPFDPSKVQIGVSEGGVARAFPDGFIASGSVAGLLRFQNHDLADARGLLGQLAAAITGQLNAQQALGLDLGTPSAFGGPLLAIGAPAVAPSSNNAMAGGVPVASYINGSGVRVSSVSISTVDSRMLQPSDYELMADPALPAGQYRLTRLSDGTTRTVTNGDVVDGFRIDIAAPPPAPRDRFLLQPVSTAARDMAPRARRSEGHRRRLAGRGDHRHRQHRHRGDRLARRGEPLDQPGPGRDHHLHRRPRQLQLQPGRQHRDAADGQRHRHFRRRPADLAQRLRAPPLRRAELRRHADGRPHRLPGRRQRQRQCAARPARQHHRRPAGPRRRPRRSGHERDRRLCRRARHDRPARAGRRRRGRAVGGDRRRRHRRGRREIGRQPRRGSGPPDPVPAELPGRGQDAADRPVALRRPAGSHAHRAERAPRPQAFARKQP